MTSVKLNWMVAASMAAMSFAVPTASAQDTNLPGIVRITDRRPGTAVQPASFHGHRQAAVYGSSGDCPTGDCPNGHCHHGYGCFQESYCKKSPDYGYSPPAKYPLHRRGVEYNAYFPHQWYGLPGGGLAGGYPMVYQPTDTTQLGFTYQHVPYWQPNPNMVPQRPVPAHWHIVAPPYQANLFANWGGGAMGANCPYDYGTAAPLQNSTPTPVENLDGAPMPIKPAPEASLPPSPREIQNSAESEHIRRAGL
ncbi:MAG: hypothetical protein H7062_16575 [Candidatus Saccharimonas sp.]|nr:hypothetical protein [Planctomycetaceae bacterium]